MLWNFAVFVVSPETTEQDPAAALQLAARQEQPAAAGALLPHAAECWAAERHGGHPQQGACFESNNLNSVCS